MTRYHQLPRREAMLGYILTQRCPPTRAQLLWLRCMIGAPNVPSIMHDYRFGAFIARHSETIMTIMQHESEHCADLAMFIAMERAVERRAVRA
jgi:hypothetical protein